MREERCPGVLPASEAGVGSSSIERVRRQTSGRTSRPTAPAVLLESGSRRAAMAGWHLPLFPVAVAPKRAAKCGKCRKPRASSRRASRVPMRPVAPGAMPKQRPRPGGRRQDGKLLHAGASDSMQDRIVGRVPEASAFIGFFLAAHAENPALIAVVDVPHPGDRSGAVLAMRGEITVQPIVRLARGHDGQLMRAGVLLEAVDELLKDGRRRTIDRTRRRPSCRVGLR